MISVSEYISYNEKILSLDNYINRNKFENKIGNIIFQLDEDSLELLDNDFKQILEDNDYMLTYDIILEGNRTMWTSNDGDELKIGDHANSRKNRSIEKGGDGGKPISNAEIINMFRWSWDDIMEMNYDGKLKPFEYQQRMVDAWTIECQCWLNHDKETNEIIYGGARPKRMNLWAVWMLEENGTKIDITIKTIFRGELRHTVVQERIRIRTNGDVEQRYKKI